MSVMSPTAVMAVVGLVSALVIKLYARAALKPLNMGVLYIKVLLLRTRPELSRPKPPPILVLKGWLADCVVRLGVLVAPIASLPKPPSRARYCSPPLEPTLVRPTFTPPEIEPAAAGETWPPAP